MGQRGHDMLLKTKSHQENQIFDNLLILPLCLTLIWFAIPSRAQTYKLDLVLILDVSNNMAGQQEIIKEGAHLATYELSAGDRFAIMSYSNKAKILSDFKEDPALIEEALQKVNPPFFKNSDLQCLNDAIFEAIKQFPQKPEPERKRVVGIITNNVDRGSTHTNAELIAAAKAKNITVWIFLVQNPKSTSSKLSSAQKRNSYPNVRFAEEQLEPFAEETGGGARVVEANGYTLRKAFAVCKGGTR
jgi:VWFA-related protein